VINVLLDHTHVLLVNGMACVTLGHGLEDDPVVRHPFWGSEAAVVGALQSLHGWAEGRVVIPPGQSLASIVH